MTLAPFRYSSEPHHRRHGPVGYDPPDGYKPWLRDEFAFCCVYCLEREAWYPDRAASFSTDHVIPQADSPALACLYTNLVYACTRCNSAKQDWRLLDPTAVAFGDHIRLGDDGILIGLTEASRYLLFLLHLNENPALKVRRQYLRIIALRARHPTDPVVESLFQEAFGYPDDMPDLRTKRPPGGNRMPDSEQTCYFAMRERGELPATY